MSSNENLPENLIDPSYTNPDVKRSEDVTKIVASYPKTDLNPDKPLMTIYIGKIREKREIKPKEIKQD